MKPKISIAILISILLMSTMLFGCGYSQEELNAVNYSPELREDWEVSTPLDEGLDPMLVAQLYLDAQNVETINSLLIIKGGKLIAEKYFNDSSIDSKQTIQSVTKSITSALVGIAIKQGDIDGVEQKMMDFFPEYELEIKIKHPRKTQITIQQLLQMRAGYPWEESSPELLNYLVTGFYPSNLVDFPLVRDPGTDFDYSNFTSHILGMIVARSAEMDLAEFAQENLFIPLEIELGDWLTDWELNYNGHSDINIIARDMAKFGQLYLDGGVYNGKQIIPAEWIQDSLKIYSEDAWDYKVGKNFNDIGYGYQWWSVRAGELNYNLAWGHGGQQIVLVEELDMVIIVTADPFYGDHGGDSWKFEKENLNLVADFIASLPCE